MNWEVVAAVSEVIGAVAVVVTLIYLAQQIRQSTNATRANASYDATHSWSDLCSKMWEMDDATLGLLEKTHDPKTDWEDVAGPEKIRLVLLHRAVFQALEGQYFLYKFGSMEQSLWDKRSKWASTLVQLPFYRTWWENEKSTSIYSDEFARAIDSIDPESQVQTSIEGRV